jgi:hypothetical protein
MRNNAVQFRGKKQVVNAYVANDMAAWSLWATKDDLTFAYEGDRDGIDVEEGADYLAQCIDALKAGGSEASYKLKVYDDWTPGAKITPKTVPSRSFNFGLYEAEEGTPYEKRQSGVVGRLEERMDKMQDALMGKLLDKLDEEEEPVAAAPANGGIGSMLNGLLDMPEIRNAIAVRVAGFISSIMPAKKNPAQVAGIDAAPVQIDPEQYKKLEQAIPMLAQVDPLLGDHLLALAQMAHNSPSKYSMALSFL